MKISERDKVLLVLLGVILIVALAVVLPGVGVMSCNEKLDKLKTDSTELQAELDAQHAQLNEMGVTSYQENATKAAESLEDEIFDLKVEASHLAGNVLAYYKPYAVDIGWLDGLEYRYGVKSDESEKILVYDFIDNVSTGSSQKKEITIVVDGVSYTLPVHERDVKSFAVGEVSCEYVVDISLQEVQIKEVGAFLLYLHNVASKGSMLITDAKLGSENTVSFTLMMPPEDSKLSQYEQEVLEELARRAAEEGEEEE